MIEISMRKLICNLQLEKEREREEKKLVTK